MIRIKLKDFLITGKLGLVELGMSRTQLIDSFGEPDMMGCPAPKSRTPLVWTYGDVEFHFAPGRAREGTIALIHLDHFKTPSGGKRVRLDPWMLRGGLGLTKVIQALSEEGILHEAPSQIPSQGVTRMRLESGVVLTFNDTARHAGRRPAAPCLRLAKLGLRRPGREAPSAAGREATVAS